MSAELRDALPSLHNGIRQATVLGLTDVTLTLDAAIAIRDSFDERDAAIRRAASGIDVERLTNAMTKLGIAGVIGPDT